MRLAHHSIFEAKGCALNMPALDPLLASVANAIPLSQRCLDAQWRREVWQWRQNAAASPEQLLPAPSRMLLANTTLDFGLQLWRDHDRQFSLQAAPLPMAYRRRYRYTSTSTHRLCMNVQAISGVYPNE